MPLRLCYFQQSRSMIALANQSASALFERESTKLARFLTSPAYATDDESVQIMCNLEKSTSLFKDKRPSKRKIGDYDGFIEFINISSLFSPTPDTHTEFLLLQK